MDWFERAKELKAQGYTNREIAEACVKLFRLSRTDSTRNQNCVRAGKKSSQKLKNTEKNTLSILVKGKL